MTLTEFLLARIEEDEGAARSVASDDGWYDDASAGLHHARWTTARVLAECEAKRRIVERYSDNASSPDFQGGYESGIEDALRALALPHAGHPDYDEAWRPTN